MNILFVENHPNFGKIVTEKFLSKHAVEIVPSLEKAIDAMSTKKFDCALVDYDLDDGKGSEFVSYVVKSGIRLPCIAVSSHEKGNNAIVSAGAIGICSKMEFSKIESVLEKLI